MRSWIVRPLNAVIVAAVVAVSGGGVYVATTTGGGSPAGTANLWVTTTAGASPSRCATACAYDSTHAYGSINAAWQAATAGDQVRVKGGALGSVTIAAKAGAADPDVVISPAVGETVSMDSLSIPGASHLTMRGDFHVGSDGIDFPAHVGANLVTTTDVTLDGLIVDGGGQTMQQLVWINGQNDGITLDHMDICCTHATLSGPAKLVTTDQFTDGSWPTPGPNTNITIQNSTLRDMTIDAGDIHSECLYASAGHGLNVRSNRFRNCVGTGDMIYSRTGAPGNVANPGGFILENNFFGLGHGSGGLGDDLPLAIQGCPFPGTIIRNNIFEGGMETGGICTSGTSSGTIVANNVGAGGCSGVFTFDKNTWKATSCSGDNAANSQILASANFVNYTGNSKTQSLSTLDLHLTVGATALIDKGSTSRFPAVDADGLTRCAGASSGGPPGSWTGCAAGVGPAPDLGMYERGAP